MLILISILLTYLCIIKTLDFLVSINFNRLDKSHWGKDHVFEIYKGRLFKNYITGKGNLHHIVLLDFRTKRKKQQHLQEFNKKHGIVEQVNG